MVTKNIASSLDYGIILGLEVLANSENTSLDILMRYLLSSYLDWGLNPEEDVVAFAPTQISMLRTLFEKLSDEGSRAMAILAANHFREYAKTTHGKFDMNEILSLMARRLRKFGFTLRIFYNSHGLVKSLVLKHNNGYKWSIFFAIFMMKLLNDTGYSTRCKLSYKGWTIQLNKSESSLDKRSSEIEYGQCTSLWKSFQVYLKQSFPTITTFSSH